MDILALSAEKEVDLEVRINAYRASLATDSNEAQTRFHVIDEFVSVELDWNKDSIRVEPYVPDAGYVDYALTKGHRCRVVLEAKRDDANLCSSEQPEMAILPLNSSALASGIEGIKQAIRYAAQLGAPIGIVTNGRQWISFLASRADGLPPMNGQAVVFPSIRAIIKNWSRFYEFFSDAGLQEGRLSNFLREREIGSAPVVANYFKAFDRGYQRMPDPTELGYVLEDMFRTSFIRMSNQSTDVLVECFVETKHSNEADVAFQKIVDDLLDRLSRVEKIDSTQPDALQHLLEHAVELKEGEFVLLVGNKGSGKTTFLQRFFQKIVPKSTRERVLLLNINLLKSEGSKDSITEWISNTLIDQAERALYGTSAPTFDELRGTFWPRYVRLRNGELSPLYKKDPDAFRQRFGEELRDFRNRQPREYLLTLLKNALAGRRLLPVLVIDNVDHLSRIIQDTVFQYAVGLSSSVTSFLICPVTDTTVWSLTKAGPLQSYHSRTFFLPVPSLKEVFARRIQLLRNNPSLAGAAAKRVTGMVGSGWKLQISDLDTFCVTVESIFVATSDVTLLIGRLCNFDIRRCLELAGAMLSSPWIGLEQLLRIFVAQGELTPKRVALVSALILQKGSLFDEDKNPFLLNVFARPSGTACSPFMALYILRYLIIADRRASNTRDRFVKVSELWSVFSAINLPREIFRHFIDRLFGRALIESYDTSETTLNDETLIRVSPAGSAHYRLTFSDAVYLSQLSLITYVENEAVATSIREEAQRDHPGWLKISRIMLKELIQEDSRVITVETVGLFAWIGAVRSDIENLLGYVSARTPEMRAQHLSQAKSD